jgi:RNA polymerase sigma-70 factor (ECF subfamily)
MAVSSDTGRFDLERYRPFLLILARSQPDLAREEASDIVQKTLLAAHVQQEQFRGTTTAEFGAWLKQILRRQLIDAYRQQRRLKRDAQQEVALEASVDGSFSRVQEWAVIQSTPSQHAAHDEELVRMAEALTRLPEAQREALVLHHLQGATLAEVAQKLDRTPAAVAGLLHRGLKQLRELLETSASAAKG